MDNNKMQNLYEVRKTVRFSLQNLEKVKEKNENYNLITKDLQKNQFIKNEIDNLTSRFVVSSNKDEWIAFSGSIKERLEELDKYLGEILKIFDNISKIENQYQSHLTLNLKKIKTKGGFGKSLYYHFNDNKSTCLDKIDLAGLLKNLDTFKKHFENHLEDFEKCRNTFDIYKLFISLRINRIKLNIKTVNINLKNENHNKEKLSEIYKEINFISKNLEIIHNHLFGIIIFNGQLREETNLIKEKISFLEKEKNNIENTILSLLEDIKDPNNGYDIGKATLHYYTLNKKSSIDGEIKKYQDFLGHEDNNRLSKDGYKILDLLYKEKRNIEAKESLIGKINYTINVCKNELNGEEITLYDIVNCLNNKNQTYDKFINNKLNFDDLGIKQRLRFALTVLVDYDIYKPKKFISRCLEIHNNAKEVLEEFNFKDYQKYKNFTKNIFEQNNIKKNSKDRGNLFNNSNIYKQAFQLNSLISGLKGSLLSYIDLLEKQKLDQEKLQFYGVLGNHNDEKILLLINKEEVKDFYEFINKKENQKGNSNIYLYNSITIKSLEKLFNQLFSENHPFKAIKEKFFNETKIKNDKLKSIDEIKFKDLDFEKIKSLFSSINDKDISKYENWNEKFKKLYEKINISIDKDSLFEAIETKGIYFEKVNINLEILKKNFSNLIISKVKNGTEKDFNNIHLEYFEKAIERMEKGKDIKEKLNPEILISYVPSANDIDKQNTIYYYKTKKYSKPGAGFNLDFLEKNHRFWRENINVGFVIEFNLPVKENIQKDFRIIGIDRGEKKIATLCNLEHKDGEISILPIEYYENNIKKYLYFLDLAYFKVGTINGNQCLIRVGDDNNKNLKKYEYLVRLQRTLWLKENFYKLEEIFKNTKNNDDIISNIENDFFNIYGLKKYRNEIFEDENFKIKIYELLNSWKDFDKNEIPISEEEKNNWFEKKNILEVNNIKLRSNITSNISGIVNFLYKNNANDGFETYISMENLHNSNWNNKFSIDKIDGTKKINNDFIEYRHNLLYGTTIYNKIEQAILNKLQVHNNSGNFYENRSINGQKTNYIKKIQNDLKYISKSENKIKQKDFYEKEISLTPAKLYGSIIFVDPFYTSKKCPKCGVFGKEGKKDIVIGHEREDDIITCTKCGFKSDNPIKGGKEKIKFNKIGKIEIYKVVGSGDENGALQIGLRGIKELLISK